MPRRSKEQNEQIRQERRSQILQAAIPLFAAHGFSATGISDVAKAAGVSHGTVFLYFESKEDLFRAALVEPLQEAEQHFQFIAQLQGTPLERIRRMVREQMNAFRALDTYIRLTQYVIGQRQRFPELVQECFTFGSRFTEALVPIVRAGQEAGELAELDPYGVVWSYFAYLNGVTLIVIEADDAFFDLLIEGGIRLFGPLQP